MKTLVTSFIDASGIDAGKASKIDLLLPVFRLASLAHPAAAVGYTSIG